MPSIAAVEAARVARVDAEHQLRVAVVAAVRAGVPIKHVADAAGVSRPTVYAWIA